MNQPLDELQQCDCVDNSYYYDDVRSAVEGLRKDHYEVYRPAHYRVTRCTKCDEPTAIGISQGKRRGWCRACNEEYWFPVFAEQSEEVKK